MERHQEAQVPMSRKIDLENKQIIVADVLLRTLNVN
jgi:hypothetical protein